MDKQRDLCRRLDTALRELSAYLVPMAAGWHDSNGRPLKAPSGGHRKHLLALLETAQINLYAATEELKAFGPSGNGGG